MNKITRVGVDLAKNLLQVHAVDAAAKDSQPSAQAREIHGVVRQFAARLPRCDGGLQRC